MLKKGVKTPFPGLFLALLTACGGASAGEEAALVPSGGLEAALRSTIGLHPAIAGKRAELMAKDYAIHTARAQMLPSLSAQASAQDNNTQPATLQGTQPVWTFGRISSAIGYAEADKAANAADLLRMQRQYIDQTAVAYGSVLAARANLAIAEDDVASLEKLHQRIRRREDGQLASKADVALALARLNQSRTRRAGYASGLAVALLGLKSLTQVPVPADVPVPSGVTELPDDQELAALAESQSADIGLKAKQVELGTADVNRERLAGMPTLALQAGQNYGQPGNGNSTYFGVVLQGNLEGMGFAALNRARAASALQQAALENLNSARNDLNTAVQTLQANRALQRSLLDSQGNSVSELTSLLGSYQRQFEAGGKSWLDLLNIQRELTDQQLQLALAESNWLTYTLKLAAIAGRLDALSGINDK